jgi:hypothetical protein
MGQSKDSVNIGTVSGILRDSLHNYAVQAGTVSVYLIDNKKLVNYQLSSNLGKFSLKQLPINTPLILIASHIGYASTEIRFNIPLNSGVYDLGNVNMARKEVQLDEVTISAKPPMVMRGDTLEFNADAFKLDTNAVVGDLLKKLPGITIWNDGVITVNGKKITRLLVDGRDFFGGDPRITLENLSKNAVEKIQVYQKKNIPDPINPPTEMNVVLKKDKKTGYFSKIGGGIGSSTRYTVDGMIGLFSPKLQLSTVVAANNVNKTTDNISTLMKFNAFKGDDINNEYFTDFRKQGSNIFKAVGVNGSYQINKKDKLTLDYFLGNTGTDLLEENKSQISRGLEDIIEQSSNLTSSSSNLNKRLTSLFAQENDNSGFSLRYKIQQSNNDNNFSQLTTATTGISSPNSKTTAIEQNSVKLTENELGLNFNLRRYNVLGTDHFRYVNLDFEYVFHTQGIDNEKKKVTDFKAIDPSQNKYFNRDYDMTVNNESHNFKLSFRDMLASMGMKKPLLKIDINNTFFIERAKEINKVSDFQIAGPSYIPNLELSNKSRFNAIDERPGVSFSKQMMGNLANRYQKVWFVKLSADAQAYYQENRSEKDFQNIQRSYLYPLPSFLFTYNNNQFGQFQKTYTINYTTSVTYPTMSQLAPLVDDANIYLIERGNIRLKPSYRQEVLFSYRYDNAAAKNPFNGYMNVVLNATSKFISDSSYYDEFSRYVRYPVNVNGQKSVAANGNLQKAFKIATHQLQLSLNSSLYFSKTPSYINNQYFISVNKNFSASTEFSYSFKDKLTASITEAITTNRTEQGDINRYSYENWSTNFGLTTKMYKGIFFNTKINFNKSISTYSDNIYFTIWNADLGYRFLKGSNAEVKFSALDLLRQNKSITNFITYNTISQRSVNVLQQYFLVSLAYYPRRFGLGKR